MPSLPLFPLGGVLLPGGRIPLQLFEPRYLELARALAEQPESQRCFGVVLIRKGHEVGADAAADLYSIGCEARVDVMAMAESAMGTVVHLIATGVRRFRLERVDPDAGTPYLTATVTWLEEPDEDDVDGLVERVARAHRSYLAALGATTPPVEAMPARFAYRVAERMVLDPSDRQHVLDGSDPGTRLRTVLALLHRERSIVDQFGALPTPPSPGGASLN
jgi:uncharacterized protein